MQKTCNPAEIRYGWEKPSKDCLKALRTGKLSKDEKKSALRTVESLKARQKPSIGWKTPPYKEDADPQNTAETLPQDRRPRIFPSP